MAAERTDALRISLLGPTGVRRNRELVGPAGAKRRTLLAMLALEANRPVSLDSLIAGLWRDRPAASAVNLVQTYVSAWRRALEAPGTPARQGRRLRTVGTAYVLDLGVEECDVLCFDQTVAAGSAHLAAGRFASAAEQLTKAIGLWQGPALADLQTVPFARDAAVTLELRRLAATEDWAHACLAGDAAAPADVAGTLERLIASDPLRERAVELLMWALCRDGRPAGALRVFDETRRRLLDELGADPGPGLRAMHADVLRDATRLRPVSSLISGSHAPAESRASYPVRISRPLPRGDSFLGRADETAALTTLLAEHRLVTLTGPGGSGKTRLAEEIANSASGSVVFVELAGLRAAADVVSAVAEGFRLQTSGGDSLQGLCRRLVNDAALLVLDNLEHLAGVAGLIERLIQQTCRLRVLATSRQPLGLAVEQRFAVRPLPLPERDETDPDRTREAMAVRLLVERARAADAAFVMDEDNAADIARVAAQLDGLPLAIEIAAPWLGVLSPKQLGARLAHLPSLTSRAERHATLDAVVEWSFSLLPMPAQRLLLRLSVFRGSASLEAIEAVCGHDAKAPALPLLGELVRRSLLEPVTQGPVPRFRLLETIRQYLDERYAGTTDHADTVARYHYWFARWTADLAKHTEGPGAALWLTEAAADLHNLRATLDANIGTKRELQLVTNCTGLWHELGHLREGIERFERALSTASHDDATRAVATANLAWLLGSVDSERALAVAEQALELAQTAGDPLILAYAYQVAGYRSPGTESAVRLLRGAIETAEHARHRRVQYAHTAPDAVRVGATNGLLQRLMFRDVEAAVALCEVELHRATAEQDELALAQFSTQIRLALLYAGRADEATNRRRPAHDVVTAGGAFQAKIADGLEHFYYGRADDAARCFSSAWKAARERGSLYGLAVVVGRIIDLAADEQRHARVQTAMADTESLCGAADAGIRSMLAVTRARLLRLAGNCGSAQLLLDSSAHVAQSDELSPTVMVWLVESAIHAAAQGDQDESRRHLESLRSRSAKTGLTVPPWEERQLAEISHLAPRRLHAL